MVGWAPMGRRGLWAGSAAAAADEPWNSAQILLQTPGAHHNRMLLGLSGGAAVVFRIYKPSDPPNITPGDR